MKLLPLIFLFLVSCSHPSVIFENNKQVFVEIPETKEDFLKGLMFRDFLPENQGMLFIFDDEKNQNFWMKNTLIPLDLIFISEKKVITNIIPAEPCTQDPCEIYGSKALYVLEVNKDFTKNNDIQPGQKVRLKF